MKEKMKTNEGGRSQIVLSISVNIMTTPVTLTHTHTPPSKVGENPRTWLNGDANIYWSVATLDLILGGQSSLVA